jgi:hypothetical protein
MFERDAQVFFVSFCGFGVTVFAFMFVMQLFPTKRAAVATTWMKSNFQFGFR